MTKEFKTIDDLQNFIEENNYYYRNGRYKNGAIFINNAERFFESITEEMEDREEYYSKFGLKIGEVHEHTAKKERYYITEQNITVEVDFKEAYIDSGVAKESYFYGYIIWNLY